MKKVLLHTPNKFAGSNNLQQQLVSTILIVGSLLSHSLYNGFIATHLGHAIAIQILNPDFDKTNSTLDIISLWAIQLWTCGWSWDHYRAVGPSTLQNPGEHQLLQVVQILKKQISPRLLQHNHVLLSV